MLNGLFRNNRRIIIIVLIIVVGLAVWFYGFHRPKSSTETAQTWEKTEFSEGNGYGYHFASSSFDGNVVFGTKGYLVKDRTLPVVLTMRSEEASFTGTLKITLPGEDGGGISYQSALNCQKGVTARVVMEIPDLGNVSYFYFEILDSFGTVRFSQKVNNEKDSETGDENAAELCFGILSGEYESFSYLNGLNVEENGEVYEIRTIDLPVSGFPTDERELLSLSGIIIDSFSSENLSQIQLRCLTDWVEEEGGFLFIGTGNDAKNVLSGLDSYLNIVPKETEEVQYRFTAGNANKGSVRLDGATLTFASPQEWKALSVVSPDGMYSGVFGEGIITVAAFSLLDEDFLQWAGRDNAIPLLFQEELEQEAEKTVEEDTGLWYVKRALYAFTDTTQPNMFYYGLFFVIYLLVLIFFSYFLLRRLKKREYIWGVVPLIAVLFTVGLMLSQGGRGNENASSFSSVFIHDTVEEQEDCYLLYQNNDGEEQTVDFDSENYTVRPLDYEYETGDADAAGTGTVTADYTINNAQNGMEIAFGEATPGDTYLIRYSAEFTKTQQTDCFRADITLNDTAFSGTITNISPWDFEEVILICGRQYEVINGLNAGEEAQVKKDEVRFWSGYDEEHTVFEGSDDMTVTGNLIEYIRQLYLSNPDGRRNVLYMIGITSDNDLELISGRTEMENQRSIFIDAFSTKASKKETVYDMNTSCLENEYQDLSLKNDILEKNEVTAVYSFDEERVVWKMYRNRDGSKGKIYAYNYETGEQDLLFENEDDVMNCLSLEPYVSDMNDMILTFRLPDGTEYGSAPVLSVVLRDTE